MHRTRTLKINRTMPAIVVILFGLIFFVGGILAIYENLTFPFNSGASIGEIVKIDNCVHLRYQREDGSSVTAKSKYICAKGSGSQLPISTWPIGSKIPIYYDLSDPNDTRLEKVNLLKIVLSFVAALLGAFVMGLGLFGLATPKPKETDH